MGIHTPEERISDTTDRAQHENELHEERATTSPLLTAEEAAASLRLDLHTKNPGRSMREFASRHGIKCVRIGRSPLFKPEDIAAAIERFRY